MISSRPYFYVADVCFEAQSAHAIHTGFGDTTHDSLVTRDANGLPTLPASSIAGALRNAYLKYFGESDTQQLFGYADGNEGQHSWLYVSWGLVHNSDNIAQTGLLSAEQLEDSLLNQLLNIKPIVRQRVQLTDRGIAKDTGKFDTTLIPAGTRYSTRFHYWCDGSQESQQRWQQFLTLLQMPIRFGQGTRNGYGLFKVCQLQQQHFDLTNSDDAQAFRTFKQQRTLVAPTLLGTENNAQLTRVEAKLNLQAESFWRVGGGEQYLQQAKDRSPDLLPMHEPKIIWQTKDDGKVSGTFSEQFYLLPATAIKGALRHRIAYHYNCLTGCFVEDDNCAETSQNLAVKTLFGYAKDGENTGEAGILAINDIYLVPRDEKVHAIMHNKIDRYTAGVMHGALFSEADLYQSKIELSFEILDVNKAIESNIKQALEFALEDLANGWLPLGASGSRGLGVFLDSENHGVSWSDKQQWIKGEA